MERDRDKFYSDDVNESQGGYDSSNHTEEIDDMKYFLELLKHIRAAIKSGANVPLTSKKIIDADKCLMMIDDMERNLPDAVQYGLQMYNERDRILGNAESAAMTRVSSAEMRANAALEKAKAEAEQRIIDAENEARAIIEDAQDRADRMIEESEIVRQANEEARIIRNDARVEANELRLKASHEAFEVLAAVEDELSSAYKSVRRRRKELGDTSD